MKLSQTQIKTLKRFKHALVNGTAFMADHPAIGGWSKREQRMMRSIPAGSIPIRTLVGLRNRGLIEHVGNSYHMITTEGLKQI